LSLSHNFAPKKRKNSCKREPVQNPGTQRDKTVKKRYEKGFKHEFEDETAKKKLISDLV